jgi:3',5'-cyclic AMP phosphodiesterase CpdA
MKNSFLKSFRWIVFSFSVFLLPACGFSSNPPASELRFAVITDTHVDALSEAAVSRRPVHKDTPAKFRRLLDALKNEKVDFVVITGDMVNFLSRANVLVLKDEIARSGLKVFSVPGNHDRQILKSPQALPDEAMLPNSDRDEIGPWKAIWKDAGRNPKSAHFEQKGYCFIFLDDGGGRFKQSSLDHASAFLDKHPDCRVFVFFHKPLKMPQESLQAAERYGKAYGPPFESGKYDFFPPDPIFPFIEHYQDQIEAVFTGHIHRWAKDRWKNRFDQFVLESGTETGMYALVKCKGSKGCDVSIREAWESPSYSEGEVPIA